MKIKVYCIYHPKLKVSIETRVGSQPNRQKSTIEYVQDCRDICSKTVKGKVRLGFEEVSKAQPHKASMPCKSSLGRVP